MEISLKNVCPCLFQFQHGLFYFIASDKVNDVITYLGTLIRVSKNNICEIRLSLQQIKKLSQGQKGYIISIIEKIYW